MRGVWRKGVAMKPENSLVCKSPAVAAGLLMLSVATVFPGATATYHGALEGRTVIFLDSDIGGGGPGEAAWDCVTVEPDGPHAYPAECGGPLWPWVGLVVSVAQGICDRVFHNLLVPGECPVELVRRYVVIH